MARGMKAMLRPSLLLNLCALSRAESIATLAGDSPTGAAARMDTAKPVSGSSTNTK
jgi:hypothetical protein